MTQKVVIVAQKRKFTLQEARALLPTIQRITKEAASQAEQVEADAGLGTAEKSEAQAAMQNVIQGWAEKIANLGCVPNGIWLVDFDNGAGYFCWQYGEEELGHFHTYEGGFAGRTAIH